MKDQAVFVIINCIAMTVYMLVSIMVMGTLQTSQFSLSSSTLIMGTVVCQLLALGGGYSIPRALQKNEEKNPIANHAAAAAFILMLGLILCLLFPSLYTYVLFFGASLTLHFLFDTYAKLILPLVLIALINLFSNVTLALLSIGLYLLGELTGTTFIYVVCISKLIFVAIISQKVPLFRPLIEEWNKIFSISNIKTALVVFSLYLLGAFDVVVLSTQEPSYSRDMYLLTKHFSYGIYTALFIELFLPFVLSGMLNRKGTNKIIRHTAYISALLFLIIIFIGVVISQYKAYPIDWFNIIGIALGMSLYGLITSLSLVIFAYTGITLSVMSVLLPSIFAYFFATYTRAVVHDVIVIWNVLLLIIFSITTIVFLRYRVIIQNAGSKIKRNGL